MLDIPLGTVKSRYYAGLQTLRKNLRDLPTERMEKINDY
ncbi:hypothetical protein ABEU82_02995 [Brevibacillus laterosporus]